MSLRFIDRLSLDLMFFLTVHHSTDFSKYQLNAQFFYSSTIYMLHYAPQHGDTIGPPDGEQRAARNMLRSVV